MRQHPRRRAGDLKGRGWVRSEATEPRLNYHASLINNMCRPINNYVALKSNMPKSKKCYTPTNPGFFKHKIQYDKNLKMLYPHLAGFFKHKIQYTKK